MKITKLLVVISSVLSFFTFLYFINSMINLKKEKEEVQYKLINTNRRGIKYDNIIYQDQTLIPFLLYKKSTDSINVSLQSIDTLLVNFQSTRVLDKDLYSTIMRFGVINEIWDNNLPWASFNQDTMFYCGQLTLIDSIDSFLFLLKSRDINVEDSELILEYRNRELFLINLCKDTITSVSSLFDYSLLDGNESFSYTYLDNNVFCYWSEILSSDDIMPNEMKRGTHIKRYYFKFDKMGRIVELSLPEL